MKRSEVLQAVELFSGLPPLEAVKATGSVFVGHCQEPTKGRRSLATYDMSRAPLHCVPMLPMEGIMKDGVDYVGLLLKTTYGTVDASARWQAH